MDPMVLSDKTQNPTDEVVFSHIGKAKIRWKSFFDYLHTEHPELTQEWRYYNDGKSWLMKVTRKSKTVFWLSVIQNGFRTTFYFTDKVAGALDRSPISDGLKDQFKNRKGSGKLHGLTVVFKDKSDLEDAKALISLKLSVL